MPQTGRVALVRPQGAVSLHTGKRPVRIHVRTEKDPTLLLHYCSACGCAPFGEGKDNSGAATAAINVRYLDDVDLTVLQVIPFVGRSV